MKYCIVYMPTSQFEKHVITGFPTKKSAYDFMCRFVIYNTCKLDDFILSHKLVDNPRYEEATAACTAEYEVVKYEQDWPGIHMNYNDWFEIFIRHTKFKGINNE